MSDRMPEYMSNRMSDCYVRIYAAAGITRSKIIVFILNNTNTSEIIILQIPSNEVR